MLRDKHPWVTPLSQKPQDRLSWQQECVSVSRLIHFASHLSCSNIFPFASLAINLSSYEKAVLHSLRVWIIVLCLEVEFHRCAPQRLGTFTLSH